MNNLDTQQSKLSWWARLIRMSPARSEHWARTPDQLPTPPIESPLDEKDETLRLRLDAARSAQERTRLAFLTVTVFSFAMLTAGWNAHLSLYRDVAREFSALARVDANKDTNSGVQELQKDFLREFVADRMINISLLGIRVGADDAPILGCVALIVALFWFYQSVRRENFVIGWLLYDNSMDTEKQDSSKDAARKIRLRIFHGIISYSIFTRAWYIDEPFGKISNFPEKQSEGLLRWITAKIYLLPLFAVYGVLLLEVVALWRSSPFRPANQSLFFTLLDEHPVDLFWRVFRFDFSIFLAVFFVRRLCSRIQRFEESTEKILRQFYLSIYPRRSRDNATTLIEYQGHQFSTVRGNDMGRDGMFLELVGAGSSSPLMEVFCSNADGSLSIRSFGGSVPLVVAEHFIAAARQPLPPPSAA